uniref:VRR-NUC domain-containing protein n=1 Tax=Pseudomonas phage Touem01 TaxID=3138548 RepID=A0AAU6W241_9VIRU
MAAESTVQKTIWLGLGAIARLFRLNSGKAYLSNLGPAGVKRLQDGSVLIKSARTVSLGLALPTGDPVNGQSDLAGWTSVIITPEMVGKRLAVFTAIETKRTKGGKTSDDQLNFVSQVSAQGGIAGIANSLEVAQKIIDEWANKIGAIL